MSRIDTPRPLSKVLAGRVAVAGVAWAQHRGVDKVEVRVDGVDWKAGAACECALGRHLAAVGLRVGRLAGPTHDRGTRDRPHRRRPARPSGQTLSVRGNRMAVDRRHGHLRNVPLGSHRADIPNQRESNPYEVFHQPHRRPRGCRCHARPVDDRLWRLVRHDRCRIEVEGAQRAGGDHAMSADAPSVPAARQSPPAAPAASTAWRTTPWRPPRPTTRSSSTLVAAVTKAGSVDTLNSAADITVSRRQRRVRRDEEGTSTR